MRPRSGRAYSKVVAAHAGRMYPRAMRTSHLLVGVATAASIALLGCGETVIDSSKVEKSIGRTVIDQAGVHVKSVSCPKDPKAKKGATFTCTVTATDGTKGDATVTQSDDDGNVRTSAPFLHTRDAEAQIAAQIKKQAGVTVKVTCREIVIAKAGEKFRCKASDGKVTRDIQVTMTDDQGNFTAKIV